MDVSSHSGGPYAHSFVGKPEAEWEYLPNHLQAVAQRAAILASDFGWAGLARTAGLLHDIGKCSPDFLDYLRRSAKSTERLRGPDHSTAGARAATQAYPGGLGTTLAYIIAGHHCGLADWPDLERRLNGEGYKIPDYAGWERYVGTIPRSGLSNPNFKCDPAKAGFGPAFLIRMLFSALVDADSLATEEVYAKVSGDKIERGGGSSLETLRDRLRGVMDAKEKQAAKDAPSELNMLRARILRHVKGKAGDAPGLFTLTVPTGGGKTLASLSFALEHAVTHGLRRVVYVIPYTSIIEQTADVFRAALASDTDILEHHANFDWDRGMDQRQPDSEGSDALRKLRLASENWDVPIVVTTAVQFYESLFSNRRSRCRKLHNLAKSVIVLDEAHMMPLKYLLPAMAVIEELQRNYGATVILCTATQPALRAIDNFEGGFAIDDKQELAPDSAGLYEALDRFDIDWKPQPVPDQDIVERFTDKERMLVVVNTRKHAKALFKKISHMAGARHLSTLMCPAHRRKVLDEIKKDLEAGRPVRLVSTSLIECGVDVDFPEVWRAAAGLDAILQAGGRCNREGGPIRGRLVVFQPADEKVPGDMLPFWEAASEVQRNAKESLNRLKSIRAYFSLVYWKRSREALDAAKIDGRPGILAALNENQKKLTFPFEGIANAFVMIEDENEPVVVPWCAAEGDRTAEAILARIRTMDKPYREDLRKLQQFTVGISPKVRGLYLKMGLLTPVHAALGDTLLKFSSLMHYDELTGLEIETPEVLPTAASIISRKPKNCS